MTVLTTPRLTLTPVSLSDFDDIAALWQDEAFTRHITGRALPEEDVWSRLLRDLGHWSALGRGNWSMRTRDDGRYVGSVGVLDYRRAVMPALDAPELGWGIGGAFQGQGLAREGVEAALAWADAALQAPRTVCMIAPGNLPSIRLAGRVGFVTYAEGTYHGEPTLLLERVRFREPHLPPLRGKGDITPP
ncbi:GNAT family N-acetyltransferase [Brevundimonas sp. LM2]|uniref:GNAT family N-acetyltransferase n=1 Tax=Brevundimonas sp. LM2 TaxID=1938605 RepID=UPI000983987C|nr:GNAT family N-acetyltransferase [Brevundimonas sp. LM2]AQR61090.1 GNAT family N-acetyltransferase [Brevundimonas sp. LM2]